MLSKTGIVHQLTSPGKQPYQLEHSVKHSFFAFTLMASTHLEFLTPTPIPHPLQGG